MDLSVGHIYEILIYTLFLICFYNFNFNIYLFIPNCEKVLIVEYSKRFNH